MLKALNASPDARCIELLSLVQQGIDAFVGEAPQFDDITMLAVEINVKNKLMLKPGVESVSAAASFVEKFLQQSGASAKAVNQINIAVDEIYSNIVRYSGAQSAEIFCAAENGRVSVTFSDDGKEYNPLNMPDPDIGLSAEERKIGGLGIFMVKKSMDEVLYEYKDGRNILTVIKEL